MNYMIDTRLHKFQISADGGKTWTEQYLTYREAAAEYQKGHIVKYTVLQECMRCGKTFHVTYCSDNTYTYDCGEYPCLCEDIFFPHYEDEPTMGEFGILLLEG